MILLDCTLRDGGYYNDWDFPRELVSRYLTGMSQAGIRTVEVGFRFLDPPGFAGATAHTTDAYLEGLAPPDDLTLGVMLNAKDIVGFPAGPVSAVNRLFQPSSASPVDLVRIATSWDELGDLRAATDRLRGLGYDVGVNLMQIHGRTADQLEQFGQWCTEAGTTVAYFADSFGGLYPSDIGPIVSAIGSGFEGPIGCHLHDNMSLALANSLAAVDAGATWVDATIRGMGRGPGNAKTEYLALEFARRSLIDVDVQQLIELVSVDFAELQERHGWGSNLFYYLSAIGGVHPTYVQRMTSDSRYGAEDVFAAVERLADAGGRSFNMDHAVRAGGIAPSDSAGSWDATAWCDGRSVLILGPGDSVQARRSDIERFVATTEPVVVNLNLVPQIDPNLIDAYIVCNPMRAKLDVRHLRGGPIPVIGPSDVIDALGPANGSTTMWDYGIEVQQGVFRARPTSCVVPQGLVAAYALAVARQGGAKQIALIGLDGFGAADPRQAEMVDVIDRFTSDPQSPPVVALTPTTYPVPASSVYAPAAL